MCELFVEMMFACSSMAIQVIGPMAEYSGHCSITNPPLLPIYLPPLGTNHHKRHLPLILIALSLADYLWYCKFFQGNIQPISTFTKTCPKGLLSILSKLSPPFFCFSCLSLSSCLSFLNFSLVSYVCFELVNLARFVKSGPADEITTWRSFLAK